MRKTPTPAKITFAGENTWDLNVRGNIPDDNLWRLAMLVPSPRAAENAHRTVTVLLSHCFELPVPL
jgi:hypothetical protein